MRARWLLPLSLAAACFGEGPIPTTPPDVTVLMAVPAGNSCGVGHYLGPVSIGATYGYTVVLPFQSRDNCDNGDMGGTGDPPSEQAQVWQFSLDGSETATQIATAGMTEGRRNPRIQATGVGVNFVYQDQGLMKLNVGGVPEINYEIPYTSGSFLPAGLIRDSNRMRLYVGAHATNDSTGGGGKSEPNNPNYPCCGPPSGGTGSPGFVFQIPLGGPPAQMAITRKFACEYSGRCFVGNTDGLVYLAHADTGSGYYVGLYPKDGVATEDEQRLATMDGLNTIVPVGLAANDAVVAWTMAPSYDSSVSGSSSSGNEPKHCEVGVYDLAAGALVQPALLDTDKFTCTGAATDEEFIYFAIVENTNRQHFQGIGLGRVNIATRAFESVAISVFGRSTGIRRLFIGETDMFLVDPFAVVKIAKSAFAGKQEIAP
jgi:hypothetical protein